MASTSRSHPRLSISPSSSSSSSSIPPPSASWSFLVTPPERDPLGLWSDNHRSSVSFTSPLTVSDSFPNERVTFPMPRHSPISSSNLGTYDTLPIPQSVFSEHSLQRSTSQKSSTLRPPPNPRYTHHRSTKSEVALTSSLTASSRPASFVESSGSESSPEFAATPLPEDFSKSLLSEEQRLRHFQEGKLAEAEEEWHLMVPKEAQQVLDREEVQRQSVIFEVIKSERDYVRDLVSMKEVFIQGLRDIAPISSRRLEGFVSEVFYNLDEILYYHQDILSALFARQLDQHPIVQGIADILLGASVDFGLVYEKYIQHYPLAEALHRTELRKNPQYQSFLSQCSDNPRIRKRDIITFLSRPVTRLPRLSLLLQAVDKHTAPELDDKKDLPLILELLNKYIKSSQPGIEAAESKVKFWALCESLVYQRGEIIDMDLYDQNRTLLHVSPLYRRYRSKADMSHTWAELHVALLDNYLLILRREERPDGFIRYGVVSRPIPLEYLRLDSFDGIPELRKEKDKLPYELFRSSRTVKMYPFKVYHASSSTTRAYTFFAAEHQHREMWKEKLEDALAVRRIGQDANKWFGPIVVSDRFFRQPGLSGPNLGVRFSGKITCAAPFSSGGKNFVAIGCPSGVYVLQRDDTRSKPRKILQLQNSKWVHALQDFNRFLVLFDGGLYSYSLDLLARVSLSSSAPQSLDASLERITGSESVTLFAKVGRIGQRTMLFYVTKSIVSAYLHALTAIPSSEVNSNLSKRGIMSFRSFGEPVAISRDAYDITALHKHIGICSERGIQVADPTNLSISTASPTIVPNFSGIEGNLPMQTLQQRCAGARPLGLVKCDNSQLIVVFNDVGCYINKDGTPARSSGYLRWETRADSFAHRGGHLILVSSSFVEIRALNTGKLVQVIEGEDIRLVHSSDRSVMVSMKGLHNGSGDTEYKLIELVETADLAEQQMQSRSPGVQGTQSLWEEWDM